MTHGFDQSICNLAPMDACTSLISTTRSSGTTKSHWITPIGLKCLEEAEDAVPAPGKRGDIIIFSSLAPHRTGPNLKAGTVRKAYILQYAPDGAEAWTREGDRVPQTDPDRQFPILKDGKRP